MFFEAFEKVVRRLQYATAPQRSQRIARLSRRAFAIAAGFLAVGRPLYAAESSALQTCCSAPYGGPSCPGCLGVGCPDGTYPVTGYCQYFYYHCWCDYCSPENWICCDCFEEVWQRWCVCGSYMFNCSIE